MNEEKKTFDIKIPHAPSMLIFERIKLQLDKKGKNVEWLALQVGMKNKATLYVAFKKGSVSMILYNKIALVLDVNLFWFFEDEITERLVSRVAISASNRDPTLKNFLFLFQRYIKNGDPFDYAVIMSSGGSMSELM
jgi:hypothetical protein